MTWWEWVILMGYIIPAFLGITLIAVAYVVPGKRLRWLVEDAGPLSPEFDHLYGEVVYEGEEDQGPLGETHRELQEQGWDEATGV